MTFCVRCRGACACGQPASPGSGGTYDPERGGWMTWEKWRAKVTAAARSTNRSEPMHKSRYQKGGQE